MNRLSQLDLSNTKIGQQIIFCPECLFQYEQDTIGKNWCENCKITLNIITMSEELVTINKDTKNE